MVHRNFSFTSGALERAAQLRADETTRIDPAARTLVFWRGKLLADRDGHPALIALGDPALKDVREPPLFVGLAEGVPLFAADLALWTPHEDAATIGQFVDQSQQMHPAWPDAGFAEVRGLMPGLTPVQGETIATARALLGWHGSHRFCANCGHATSVETSGWVRKCPNCAAQHFPRTDPVVIMAITHGDRLLLGRSPNWPEGMYSLLAGFVEPGETVESAVRREVLEESGIRVERVRYVACQPWPFPMSLMFGCHGEAISEEITIDPTELADARWVDRDEVLKLLAGQHETIAPPRHGAIAGALIEAWAKDRLLDPDHWQA
ncbi:NAD(+) diphosphatase [Devosia sp. PTR5]|uniref:NAD(+) diphosphatase n=1 Tax=Devosia oryzisoli TaxID=2774138 RepID=A0A927FU60_9HYPH|nr:NAD(+) diphosphatase [Devosia oryzisoli]